ncbi:MAG: glycosyltransferase family 2 protein [Colwellia sp.]
MITVVITTYKRKKLLRRCLFSVISQPLVNEIIVVDDGNDPIIKRYVTFIQKKLQIKLLYAATLGSEGACRARNVGINLANDSFVTFVDDDDYILPNRFLPLRDHLLQNKHSFYSTGRIVDVKYGDSLFIREQKFGYIDYNSISRRNHIDIGFVCSRTNLLNINGFNESLNCFQDWDLISRLILEYGVGIKVKKFSYMVNEDPNLDRISSSVKHMKGFLSYKDRFNKHLTFFDRIVLHYEASGCSSNIYLIDFLSPFASLLTLSSVPLKRSLRKIYNKAIC